MISNPSCKDMARELIQNFQAEAPFRVEVANRSDLRVVEYNLEKSMDGGAWLSIRVEDVKPGA